jgi:hypothetical protein
MSGRIEEEDIIGLELSPDPRLAPAELFFPLRFHRYRNWPLRVSIDCIDQVPILLSKG